MAGEREHSPSTMGDAIMSDSRIGADHSEEINKVDTSENNYGSTGLPSLSSEQSTRVNIISSDQSYSTKVPVSNGTNKRQRASDLLFGLPTYAEQTKSKIIDSARLAMGELVKISIAGKPLWQPQKEINRYETLNDIEYLRHVGQVDTTLREIMKLVEVGGPQTLPSFNSYQRQHSTSNINPRATLQVEASRDMACLNMSPNNFVDLLMDVNQWSRVFYNIVSRATILETISDGVNGSYDGALHVMSAELHLPTLLVPTRECYFARYCKQFSDQKWVVVDVSLDKFFPSPSSNFHKRPSGCLIKGTPNGRSKVLWFEHVEADHSKLNDPFKRLVASGLGFGAARWLASVVRHIRFSETLNAPVQLVGEERVNIPQSGRTSFLKLADRMMRTFCANVSATAGNPWMQMTSFPGSEDVKVMIKNNTDVTPFLGKTTVVFTTSLRLQVSPNRLFNYLRHPDSRNKWDLLSRELSIIEFAYMIKGQNPGNRVSLLRAITSWGEDEIYYVQESYTDSTCSYMIYAPLEERALIALAKGCNPDTIMVLPSGFSILPAVEDEGKDRDTAASLLTIAFYIIDLHASESYIPAKSVETMHRIITDTITSIKDVVK